MERTIAPAVLKFMLSDDASIKLLDVRRGEDRAREPAAIPGASWHDPTAVDEWSTALSPEQAIVLYCVRGGSVSNSVVDTLHAKGLQASFIAGGLQAWKAAGGQITSLQ